MPPDHLPLYWIDAFSDRLFQGNPAAVCPLVEWLDDALMQRIAAENNLSETAFFVREGDHHRIRWFTPAAEVDLCGHATLAAAHVIFECAPEPIDTIEFASRSGPLSVTRDGERIVLDFPADPPRPVDPSESVATGLGHALGVTPLEIQRGRTDFVVSLKDADAVVAVRPDFTALRALDVRGVIVTAPGTDVDFVSRFFAPSVGIDEDPVTGSAHTTLAPLWAARLGKTALTARQVSARGGELTCELAGDRVRIGGRATTYLVGTIDLRAATPLATA